MSSPTKSVKKLSIAELSALIFKKRMKAMDTAFSWVKDNGYILSEIKADNEKDDIIHMDIIIPVGHEHHSDISYKSTEDMGESLRQYKSDDEDAPYLYPTRVSSGHIRGGNTFSFTISID